MYKMGKLHISRALKLLLSGFRESDLIDQGFSNHDIEKAHKFMNLAQNSDKMLTKTMAEIMGLPKSSINHMLKIYRQYAEAHRIQQ
jgi:uncharacterized protein Smg (DUF494 family)